MFGIRYKFFSKIVLMADVTLADSLTLEKYKAYWDYYKMTITNRKDLMELYFKIVGIPLSVISFFGTLEENSILNKNILGLLFLVLTMSGIGLLIAYSKESGNSVRYLDAIKEMEIEILKFPHTQQSKKNGTTLI